MRVASLHPPPPAHPILPYTTLFRSRRIRRAEGRLSGLNDTFGAPVTDIRPMDGRMSTIRQIPEVFVSGSRDHRRGRTGRGRSEEHTSELQSLRHLVCRLLLEKKNDR